MVLPVIDTVKKGFSFLRKDPGLIALFALPLIGEIPLTIIFHLGMATIGLPTPKVGLTTIAFPVLCGIISWLLTIWAQAGAILKVERLASSEKLELSDSLRKGLGKFPRLLGATILMELIILAIFSPIIYPLLTTLIISKIGAIPAGPEVTAFLFFPLFFFLIPISLVGIYVWTRLALFPPACVLENTFGLKSSWRSVKGSWWRLFGILIIFSIIYGIISSIPFVGGFLATLFIAPAMTAAMTLAYFSLKK